MNQGEFTHILDTFIRPKVAELISKATFEHDKLKYIEIAWNELRVTLESFDFDNDTFKDLHIRYRNQIETEIRKKYFR